MKKILIVGLEPFIPITSGSRKVVFEYCKLLKSMGHELYFCNHGITKFSQEFLDFMENRVFALNYTSKKSIYINKFRYKYIEYYKKKTKYNHIDDLCPLDLGDYVKHLHDLYQFDMCIVNYVTLSKVLEHIDVERKVIFTHDAFTHKHELLNVEEFSFSLSPNEEAKGLRRATDILAIQENEAQLFHYYNPKARIYKVFSFFPIKEQSLTYNNNILFLSGNNQLNRNGIDYFLKEVYPIILDKKNDVKLIIGGAICNYLQNKKLINTELLGYIDNPDDFYAMGDIAINPIYQGTGLKIKTFEALSYGKLCVVTPHSIEGIYNPHKAPLFIGHTNKEYANLIISLLENKNERQNIAHNSIQYIQELNDFILNEYMKLLNF